MMGATDKGHIYTVQGLTREIKTLLEDKYPFLWVTGEISNLAVPASGHAYFSLKDQNAVISAVMFKGQRSRLTFKPENGMKVTGMARLSLYEPRGSYQLIFEYITPDGAGALQVAFEQLKKKLSEEGLFDPVHKKQIPFMPQKINVITSGTGAAVRDIIHVAGRRFPGCALEIVPVRVQGDGAENEIASAIRMVNDLERSELIILARGGGSIEDLQAFNTETVARAVFDSQIPVISGVGHETDFTIADFVADLRAPTPSAAAEMALPDRREIMNTIQGQKFNLLQAMNRRLFFFQQRLDDLSARIKRPDRFVRDLTARVTDDARRLEHAMTRKVTYGNERLTWIRKNLANALPLLNIEGKKQNISSLRDRLSKACSRIQLQRKGELDALLGQLSSLSPQAVLDRGYSITRRLSTGQVVRDAEGITHDDRLEIVLSKGRLVTRVEKES